MKKIFEEQQTKRAQLRPCPFCGGEAKVIVDFLMDGVKYCCTCTECEAKSTPYAFRDIGTMRDEVFDKMEEKKEKAIEAWNKRDEQ